MRDIEQRAPKKCTQAHDVSISLYISPKAKSAAVPTRVISRVSMS
ncbi:hypothetical protein M3J09_002096 [Ascochyta lentis]